MRKLTLSFLCVLAITATVYAARCATIEVVAMTPVVAAGAVEPISALAINCDSKSAQLRSTIVVTSACGEVVVYEVTTHEKPGRGTAITVAHQTDSCVGTSTVEATVRVANQVLDTASTSFVVQ